TDPGHLVCTTRWCLRSGDDELDRGVRGQLGNTAGGDHLSVTDDPDTVTELFDQFELVAREHHRHPGGRVLPQHVAHHVHRDRIEPGERLVQYQYIRIVNQGGRQLDALLVAQDRKSTRLNSSHVLISYAV